MKPIAIKNTKKKHGARSSDFGRQKPKRSMILSQKHAARTFKSISSSTSDLYLHPQSSTFSIDPNQFTYQHFRSISSSTINLQILTKKKQIRGNKVPNNDDGDGDEAQSELQR